MHHSKIVQQWQLMLAGQRFKRLGWISALVLSAQGAWAQVQAPLQTSQDCSQKAGTACWYSLDLPAQAGRLHYYASRAPGLPGAAAAGPTEALLVMHGHSRDVNRSFVAGLQAARLAGKLKGVQDDVLVLAPLFGVAASQATRCHTQGVPEAQPGDALWTCGSWLAGQRSLGPRGEAGEVPTGRIASIAALDALLSEMKKQWPGLRSVTLAGFSAGAQMLQRSAVFAAAPPQGLTLRYVIAAPGSWLYFDAQRPQPQVNGQAVDWTSCTAQGAACRMAFEHPDEAVCPGYNRWKYGIEDLPAHLTDGTGSSAGLAALRERYRQARIDYLAGELDSNAKRGSAYSVLDTSCAAMLQGPFRLQRAQGYAAYDQALLQPAQPRRLTVVPGCAHDVACVLPSPEARRVLFAP